MSSEPQEQTSVSGLRYIDYGGGSGEAAAPGDRVAVHYTGTLENGKKFDSSRDRGQPFEFHLGQGQVIKGWDEGVAGMRVGDKRRLIIPSDLGYGSRVRAVLAGAQWADPAGQAEEADPAGADSDATAVPPDLIGAAIAVLAGWQWQQRPVAVVHVGSRSRPLLVADLAGQLSRIGRLADLGGIEHVGGSATGRSSCGFTAIRMIAGAVLKCSARSRP